MGQPHREVDGQWPRPWHNEHICQGHEGDSRHESDMMPAFIRSKESLRCVHLRLSWRCSWLDSRACRPRARRARTDRRRLGDVVRRKESSSIGRSPVMPTGASSTASWKPRMLAGLSRLEAVVRRTSSSAETSGRQPSRTAAFLFRITDSEGPGDRERLRAEHQRRAQGPGRDGPARSSTSRSRW